MHIAQVFLEGEDTEAKQKLRTVFVDFHQALREALVLHGELVRDQPNYRNLQTSMEAAFDEISRTLEPLAHVVSSQPVSATLYVSTTQDTQLP